jgi:hypothetical protein
MALEPGIAILEVTPVARQHRTARPHAGVSDYWALTKPEINFLIAIATFAGFYLGLPTKLQAFPFMLLIHTLLGTLLVSSGDCKAAARFRKCRSIVSPLARGCAVLRRRHLPRCSG